MSFSERLRYIGACVLGFFLPFNVYLLPWSSQTPRAADVLGLAIACIFVGGLLLSRRVKMRSLLRVLFILALLLPVIWHGVLSGRDGTTVYAIRWIIAVFWASAIWRITMDDRTRCIFLKSLTVGCVGCIGVIALQFAGFFELTQRVGLAPQDSVSDVGFRSVWRVPGMERNVNGSAAVVSLAVPVAIGLVEERKVSLKCLLVILGLVVISAAATLNRSSMLVTVVTLVVWVMLSKSQQVTRLVKFLVVSVVVGIVFTYGPPGGWERWSALSDLGQSSNFQVRYETTLEALRLTALHPLGIGLDYKDLIAQNTISQHGATHNAFLQIGLRGGWPILIAIVIRLGQLAVRLPWRSCVEGWIALHLVGLFFFEEYLANFTIVVLVVWLLLRPLHYRFSSTLSAKQALAESNRTSVGNSWNT